MVLDLLDFFSSSSSSSSFFFFWCRFFCWVFLVSLFLLPSLGFWVVANSSGLTERDIKYNEKDTFIPIFNSEKGKVGCGCLTEGTSIGDLSGNF